MAGFFHGIKTYQIPTAIVPPRKTMSALPVAFGCAPIHRLSAEARAKVMPGKIAMVYGLVEAGVRLGIDVQRDDFEHWTLSEVVFDYFVLFNVAPVVFVNLFDPDKHKKAITNEEVAFSDLKAQLKHADIIGSVTLTPTMGGEAYVAGIDYMLNAVTGEITILEGGALEPVDRAKAAYAYAAPEMVTVDEGIGGYDVVTGITTGISLVDDVFPWFREVPAIAIAPKIGEDPVFAAILAAKMSSVNGLFKGVAYTDIPSDGANAVKLYTDVPEYKQRNNLVSEDLYLCWPKVKMGDLVLRLSVQAAALTASVDADNKDIPYASPSNKNLQMTACVVNGEEVRLDIQRANYLNGNGIATALNWQDGWKLWGNRTACYPDVTDPKDAFITGRRMMAWYGNRLILTYWSKVDWPMARRLILTIVNSENYNLNSLTAAECLHGGRITFLESENGLTDLIDGQFTFHVYLGLIPPSERFYFNLEYDTNYMLAFFRGLAA